MALRKRRTSRIVAKSEIRLSGMQTINEQKGALIDYGEQGRHLSSNEVRAQIKLCEDITNKYNQALQTADALANELLSAERVLSAMYAEVLAGGKAKFGLDSSEVEILGGKRISERKKRARKQR